MRAMICADIFAAKLDAEDYSMMSNGVSIPYAYAVAHTPEGA